MKKALITVKLVPESSKESNSQIEKEILEKAGNVWTQTKAEFKS
jgi:hypothetical protein